ncbi:phosphodiester glycosidase family protein [Streptomyces sp. NPDC093085]|uniref:phosphodiester glycosidase family protein n=1 Tax=Streptomyces sp. NPDC093085 TaxID=3155068 RepID=UPI00343D27D8
MNAPTDQATDPEERNALVALRARGFPVTDIQILARDQNAFARRSPYGEHVIAPGVRLTARPVELEDGFTNAFTLTVDLDRAQCHAVSSSAGFHLRDLVRDRVVAAVSGSFSYISDEPAYQPTEPCLDLAIRDGRVAGLPTATKPALLISQGRPEVRLLTAVGTLTAAGHLHTWAGSKEPRPQQDQPGHLTVYTAANCRIRYRDNARTGFLRDVDPTTNTTPFTPGALDCAVSPAPDGLKITAVRPGGGADLFAGAFILRAHRPWPGHLAVGAPVRVTSVDTVGVEQLRSALSLGPSVMDAADGHTEAWDQSLGTSPFRPAARYARTLLALRDRTLQLQVLDGAPLTRDFQGATVRETADLCTAAGLDPVQVFHLDGGQTSKIAFRRERRAPDVVGSLHYLKWPATDGEPFRWQGLDGRLLRSALVITISRGPR